jgi:Flp pilus assembly protein TadB
MRVAAVIAIAGPMVRIVRSLPMRSKERAWALRGKLPGARTSASPERGKTMNLLWVIAVVFFVFWILGFAAFHVTSGFIHVLLVLAVIAVVFRLVTGRQSV